MEFIDIKYDREEEGRENRNAPFPTHNVPVAQVPSNAVRYLRV